MGPNPERAREARLRRLARRHGYRVVKSRARNPWSPGYGGYAIVDSDLNAYVSGDLEWGSLDLDVVEEWLSPLALGED